MKHRSFTPIRMYNASIIGVFFDGVKRHSSAVNTPTIRMKRIKLRCNKRLEHGFVQRRRDSVTIVDHSDMAKALFLPAGNKNGMSICISRIAKHFNNDILK